MPNAKCWMPDTGCCVQRERAINSPLCSLITQNCPLPIDNSHSPLTTHQAMRSSMICNKGKPILLLVMIASSIIARAQFNGFLQPVDLSDHYRVIQLTDTALAQKKGILHHSFLLRPFVESVYDARNKKPDWGFTSVSYTRYYNDSIGGSGYNSENLYAATGWQERLSVGGRFQYKGLHIQVQPEWLMVQNRAQAMISTQFTDANFFSRYYFYNINTIDQPSRPGMGSFNKVYPGQSFIRYEFSNGIAAGVSTENIWWGPGLRNALLMTNNAPGFLHAGIQTLKPLKTALGYIEAQALIGRLDSSGVEPVENQRQFAEFWPGAYVPRISQSKRGIAAIMLSWQPRWVPNLYIGFAASRHYYNAQKDSLGQSFPDYPYTSSPQDTYHASLGSIFMRYVMPGDRAELYAEFGRADKVATVFNLFGDTIPLAYTVGLRKLLPIGINKGFIDIAAEITHLQLPDPRLIFTADNPFGIPKTRSWYTHPRIRQGYTHIGKILGAGIGPGSNSQTISISWIKGFNRIGIRAERVAHNKDFYYYSHISGNLGGGIHNQYWTDVSISLHGQYSWKQVQLAGAITSLSALNYRWVKVDGEFDGPSSSDKRNLNITLSLRYILGK